MAKTKDLGFQDKWIGKKAHVFLDPDRANISIVYWPKGWPGGNERYTRDYSHPALAKTAYRKMTTLAQVDRFRSLAKRSNPKRTSKARRAVLGKTKVVGRYYHKNKTIKTKNIDLFIYRRGKTVGIMKASSTGTLLGKHTYKTEAAAMSAYKRITSLASAMRFAQKYGK